MKNQRKTTAEKLIVIYYASIFQNGKMRDNPNIPRFHNKTLKELSPTERKHFLRTADQVLSLDADPREYIVAQFQSFAEHSAAVHRVLLPMPHQLHTLAALVRYQRYKGQQEMRDTRKAPRHEAAKATRGFFREERRLAGLVRMNRCAEEDVLTEKPEEFTEEFLKLKGVWDVVKDVYSERSES